MIMVVPGEISRVIIDMEQCRYLSTGIPCASVSQRFSSARPGLKRLSYVRKLYFCFSINVNT